MVLPQASLHDPCHSHVGKRKLEDTLENHRADSLGKEAWQTDSTNASIPTLVHNELLNSRSSSGHLTPLSSTPTLIAKRPIRVRRIQLIDDSLQPSENPRKSGKKDAADKIPFLSIPYLEAFTLPPGKMFEVQDGRCFKKDYRAAKNCNTCITRQGGSQCLFTGLRVFIVRDRQPRIIDAKTPCFFASSSIPNQPLHFTQDFNRPLDDSQKERMKRIIARNLLPTMKLELQHASNPRAIRRPVDYKERQLCDFCLTTFFIGNWFCGDCGRDYCFDCFESIKSYLPGIGKPLHHTNASSALRNEGHAGHASTSTWVQAEAARQYDHLPPNITTTKGKIDDPQVRRLLSCIHGKPHSVDCMIPVTSQRKSQLEEVVDAMTRETGGSPALKSERDPYQVPSDLPPRFNVIQLPESLPFATIDHAQLTENDFQRIWKEGQTMVISGLDRLHEMDWSSESFSNAFAKTSCEVQDCYTTLTKKVRVPEFFNQFGKEKAPGTDNWKLKDWPPTDDFAAWEPDLYKDYVESLPVPDITKRNGVSNLAAHFPLNVNKPDLGPKMYAAYRGYDGPGGFGSTRLHVDAADAINQMVYASSENGEPGHALWVIYPASDADKIRDYCFENVAARESKPGMVYTAEMIKGVIDDPIHMQQIYLDVNMRADLYNLYGIRPWIIHQKVGDAVFIPSGSPHQVCNFADCIKVASDFVSCENIDRCWQTCAEFRLCTKAHAWREDLLQLKNMMYYAWLSCSRQSKPLPNMQYFRPSVAIPTYNFTEEEKHSVKNGTSHGAAVVNDDVEATSSDSEEPIIKRRPLPKLRIRHPSEIIPVLRPGLPDNASGPLRPPSSLVGEF